MPALAGIYKSYNENAVLRGFDLEINKGERVCLMGASGCGKTTAARILLRLEQPDSGRVENDLSVAAVFQEDRLCEDFSALSNVKMAIKSGGKAEAERLLRLLGLGGDIEKPVKNLSGGMKRRVAIARALAAKREFLVLDEPFKGLDPATRALAAEVIIKEHGGGTLLLISHESEESSLLGARVVRIEGGKAV